MLITIFTDASFDPRTHASGWSAWIKFGPGEGQTQRYSGPVKTDPGCPTGAELAAIANALFITARGLRLSPADKIILQSDCQAAIQLASREPLRFSVSSEGRRFRRRCVKIISDVISRTGVQIEYRWVKAHRGGVDRRSWVNEWCDTAAKGHMRQQRAEKQTVEDTTHD